MGTALYGVASSFFHLCCVCGRVLGCATDCMWRYNELFRLSASLDSVFTFSVAFFLPPSVWLCLHFVVTFFALSPFFYHSQCGYAVLGGALRKWRVYEDMDPWWKPAGRGGNLAQNRGAAGLKLSRIAEKMRALLRTSFTFPALVLFISRRKTKATGTPNTWFVFLLLFTSVNFCNQYFASR